MVQDQIPSMTYFFSFLNYIIVGKNVLKTLLNKLILNIIVLHIYFNLKCLLWLLLEYFFIKKPIAEQKN